MTARKYSSVYPDKTLNGGIASASSGDSTAIVLNNSTGVMSAVPYTLVIDPNTELEEIVTVTAVSGANLTVTRGQDGTSAPAHANLAPVKHMVTARDLSEPQVHINSSADVHGLATAGPSSTSGGNVVGTSASQTLTNKTLTSPTISNPTISGSITGTGIVTSDNIADGTIVNADVNASAAIDPTKIAGTAVITTDLRLSDTRTPTDGTVTTAKLVDSAVTSAKIADGTIATGDIADSAITSAKIADGTIVNADINSSAAIVASKLTGTTSEFNSALSDNDFATLAGAETLTNKKLTSPVFYQATPYTSTSATLSLSASNIDAKILRYNGTSTANHSWTMPIGSALDSYFTNMTVNDSFDFHVINTNNSGSAGLLSIVGSVSVPVIGSAYVYPMDIGAHFRLHKTGTATWNLYRLA